MKDFFWISNRFALVSRRSAWPAPESTDNMNTKRVGRLGLLDAEEDALVSFMQPLTDGFMSRDQR